jgi:orotidine-5'-phosphate decarboxylase
MSNLQQKLLKRVNNGAGRIIWAYDPIIEEKYPFKKFLSIFSDIKDLISGIKLNRQLILPYGLKHPNLQEIIQTVQKNDIPIIMDAKVNDIGYTNESITKLYLRHGFDAIIANPFVGFSDGFEPVLRVTKDLGRDTIFLVYMSHLSSNFGYGRKIIVSQEEIDHLGISKPINYFYELFAHCVNKYNASGCIVGGTNPEKIKEVRMILESNKLILSPGIGAQGGDPKEALRAGMDYAIIGRSITENLNSRKFCLDLIDRLAQ